MDAKTLEVARANTLRLGSITYLGRLIFIGKSQDGDHIVVGYSIGGRSEPSRNRVFKVKDGQVYTEAADPAKVTGDASLLIYNAMAERQGCYVVSNGDQTDNVIEAIGEDSNVTLRVPLKSRIYEPDSNATPRITGMCNLNGGCSVELSILQKSPFLVGEALGGDDCERSYYEYADITPGIAFFISTYDGDGNPLPSFSSKPYPVLIKGDIDMVLDTYWHLLNKDNKVSLAVKFINIRTGKSTVKVVNRYTQVEA